MMLYIRTQYKMALVPYDRPIIVLDNVIKWFYHNEGSIKLGTYSTKERALEVLDEIESAVYRNQTIYDEYFYNEFGYHKQYSANGLAVYHMPKE